MRLPRVVQAVGRRAALSRRLVDDVQVVSLAAVLAAVAWWFTGQRVALAFALAALPVLLGQAVAIAALSVLRRRSALEAIAAGYEDAPMPEIALVRAELLCRDHRIRLVQRLLTAASTAEIGPPAVGAFQGRLPVPRAQTAWHLLEQVVLLVLREPCESARGAALCELLLERSAFRLTGAQDLTCLEHDLQRLCFVLGARL